MRARRDANIYQWPGLTIKKKYMTFPTKLENKLEMYKMSDEEIKFTEKSMKTWKVELTAGGKSFAERNIEIGLFQGDELSPLLLIIAMFPLNYRLRNCSTGYKLSKSKEKMNHLMYMGDIKLFGKNEKQLETLIHTV